MREKGQLYRLTRSLALLGVVTLLATAGSATGMQLDRQSVPAASQKVTDDDPARREEIRDRPVPQQRNPRYQLCQGDTFDLSFPFTPQFNQTVTIHPDGFITLTALGDLYVLGKTVPELRDLLKTAYAKILREPVIDIHLKDFEKPYFVAGGQIGRPGKYELRGGTTLTQAIAIAGGFNENSKHSQVLLFRRVSSDWAEVKVLNVKKLLQGENLTEDLYLRPGDMFYVPQNTISKFRKYLPVSSMGLFFDPTKL
jgi:polysaccharide export outer membrane protein